MKKLLIMSYVENCKNLQEKLGIMWLENEMAVRYAPKLDRGQLWGIVQSSEFLTFWAGSDEPLCHSSATGLQS